MKIPKAQLGNIQILLIIFLLVGIVIGVILVQRQTNILSKAKEWGCQEPPVCLSYDPHCNVSKPFRGWCTWKKEPKASWPKPTSIARPSVSPQPSDSPLTCVSCPSGYNLCYDKETDKTSCNNPGDPYIQSSNFTCTKCPLIERPSPTPTGSPVSSKRLR